MKQKSFACLLVFLLTSKVSAHPANSDDPISPLTEVVRREKSIAASETISKLPQFPTPSLQENLEVALDTNDNYKGPIKLLLSSAQTNLPFQRHIVSNTFHSRNGDDVLSPVEILQIPRDAFVSQDGLFTKSLFRPIKTPQPTLISNKSDRIKPKEFPTDQKDIFNETKIFPYASRFFQPTQIIYKKIPVIIDIIDRTNESNLNNSSKEAMNKNTTDTNENKNNSDVISVPSPKEKGVKVNVGGSELHVSMLDTKHPIVVVESLVTATEPPVKHTISPFIKALMATPTSIPKNKSSGSLRINNKRDGIKSTTKLPHEGLTAEKIGLRAGRTIENSQNTFTVPKNVDGISNTNRRYNSNRVRKRINTNDYRIKEFQTTGVSEEYESLPIEEIIGGIFNPEELQTFGGFGLKLGVNRNKKLPHPVPTAPEKISNKKQEEKTRNLNDKLVSNIPERTVSLLPPTTPRPQQVSKPIEINSRNNIKILTTTVPQLHTENTEFTVPSHSKINKNNRFSSTHRNIPRPKQIFNPYQIQRSKTVTTATTSPPITVTTTLPPLILVDTTILPPMTETTTQPPLSLINTSLPPPLIKTTNLPQSFFVNTTTSPPISVHTKLSQPIVVTKNLSSPIGQKSIQIDSIESSTKENEKDIEEIKNNNVPLNSLTVPKKDESIIPKAIQLSNFSSIGLSSTTETPTNIATPIVEQIRKAIVPILLKLMNGMESKKIKLSPENLNILSDMSKNSEKVNVPTSNVMEKVKESIDTEKDIHKDLKIMPLKIQPVEEKSSIPFTTADTKPLGGELDSSLESSLDIPIFLGNMSSIKIEDKSNVTEGFDEQTNQGKTVTTHVTENAGSLRELQTVSSESLSEDKPIVIGTSRIIGKDDKEVYSEEKNNAQLNLNDSENSSKTIANTLDFTVIDRIISKVDATLKNLNDQTTVNESTPEKTSLPTPENQIIIGKSLDSIPIINLNKLQHKEVTDDNKDKSFLNEDTPITESLIEKKALAPTKVKLFDDNVINLETTTKDSYEQNLQILDPESTTFSNNVIDIDTLGMVTSEELITTENYEAFTQGLLIENVESMTTEVMEDKTVFFDDAENDKNMLVISLEGKISEEFVSTITPQLSQELTNTFYINDLIQTSNESEYNNILSEIDFLNDGLNTTNSEDNYRPNISAVADNSLDTIESDMNESSEFISTTIIPETININEDTSLIEEMNITDMELALFFLNNVLSDIPTLPPYDVHGNTTEEYAVMVEKTSTPNSIYIDDEFVTTSDVATEVKLTKEKTDIDNDEIVDIPREEQLTSPLSIISSRGESADILNINISEEPVGTKSFVNEQMSFEEIISKIQREEFLDIPTKEELTTPLSVITSTDDGADILSLKSSEEPTRIESVVVNKQASFEEIVDKVHSDEIVNIPTVHFINPTSITSTTDKSEDILSMPISKEPVKSKSVIVEQKSFDEIISGFGNESRDKNKIEVQLVPTPIHQHFSDIIPSSRVEVTVVSAAKSVSVSDTKSEAEMNSSEAATNETTEKGEDILQRLMKDLRVKTIKQPSNVDVVDDFLRGMDKSETKNNSTVLKTKLMPDVKAVKNIKDSVHNMKDEIRLNPSAKASNVNIVDRLLNGFKSPELENNQESKRQFSPPAFASIIAPNTYKLPIQPRKVSTSLVIPNTSHKPFNSRSKSLFSVSEPNSSNNKHIKHEMNKELSDEERKRIMVRRFIENLQRIMKNMALQKQNSDSKFERDLSDILPRVNKVLQRTNKLKDESELKNPLKKDSILSLDIEESTKSPTKEVTRIPISVLQKIKYALDIVAQELKNSTLKNEAELKGNLNNKLDNDSSLKDIFLIDMIQDKLEQNSFIKSTPTPTYNIIPKVEPVTVTSEKPSQNVEESSKVNELKSNLLNYRKPQVSSGYQFPRNLYSLVNNPERLIGQETINFQTTQDQNIASSFPSYSVMDDFGFLDNIYPAKTLSPFSNLKTLTEQKPATKEVFRLPSAIHGTMRPKLSNPSTKQTATRPSFTTPSPTSITFNRYADQQNNKDTPPYTPTTIIRLTPGSGIPYQSPSILQEKSTPALLRRLQSPNSEYSYRVQYGIENNPPAQLRKARAQVSKPQQHSSNHQGQLNKDQQYSSKPQLDFDSFSRDMNPLPFPPPQVSQLMARAFANY